MLVLFRLNLRKVYLLTCHLEQRFGGIFIIQSRRHKTFAICILPVHDSTELLPHIISRLQTSVVHEVVVAPLEDRKIQWCIRRVNRTKYLWVLHVLFECVIDVQQREVVTIDVGKSGLDSGVSKRTQHPGPQN